MLISRRDLLKLGGSAALLSAVTPLRVFSRTPKLLVKKLWLYNTHTGEVFKEEYWEKGRYDPSALKRLNFLMRDHRRNEVKPINLSLLELLFQVQKLLNYNKPFDLISGYRSAKTNAMLGRHSREVAKASYHTKGMAADLHFRGLSLERARKAVAFLRKGGVGYYPKSGFLHMDVRGQFRQWAGT